MKAIVYDQYTDCFPSEEEIKLFCCPGEGDNTCIWLIASEKGFGCCYHHRPGVLIDRFMAGKTNAKRDGCDKMKNFDPTNLGEIIF